MTPEALDRYEKRQASLSEIARDEGVGAKKLRRFLIQEGATIRPGGRPGGESKQPSEHQLITARYSCTHPRVPGYTQCPTCDSCQCPPKKRRPLRKYPAGWLCLCGRVIRP